MSTSDGLQSSGPVREFAGLLAPGALILDAGCGEGRELKQFGQMGFRAEGIDISETMVTRAQAMSGCVVKENDLMMATLNKESHDGIWAHQLMSELPKHGCQRVMAIFFAALKPRGILFVSILEANEGEESNSIPYRYAASDFASLIRQSGFQLISQGKSLRIPDQVGFLARRI